VVCGRVVFSGVYEEAYQWLADVFVFSIRGLTVKFANSPPCACRGSTGQKPKYSLMTLIY